MSKRSDSMDNKNSDIVYSRIRLAQNWDRYAFPSRMTAQRCGGMLECIKEGLKNLPKPDENPHKYRQLNEVRELEKLAFRERRILSLAAVNKEELADLLLSEDEGSSLVLGEDDHIYVQFLTFDPKLDELWQEASAMNDYINERHSYAFDEKYGYLTSFLTDAGTGLRACVVLHLPTLSQMGELQSIVSDMSRLGAAIRGFYGGGSDNYGGLYEVFNQKALELPREEIAELVAKAASQLNNQEMRVRNVILDTQGLEREDEIYKSHDVLKHTKKISEEDARILISQSMTGEGDGLMSFDKECSLYNLILGIRPADLNLWAERLLGKDEMDSVRAAYVRQSLPKIEVK